MSTKEPSSASKAGTRSANSDDAQQDRRQAKRARTGNAAKPWARASSRADHGAFESMEQRYQVLLRDGSLAKAIEGVKKEFNGTQDQLGAFFVWKCKSMVESFLQSEREPTVKAAHTNKCNEAVALAKGAITLRPKDNEAKYHAAYALKLAGHKEPALKLLAKAPRTDDWSSALEQLESRCQLHSAIEMLPEHTFVDIVALLQTHELAQASVVCRRWNAVASTPYLWRHLSFVAQSRIGNDGGYASMFKKEQKKLFGKAKVPWDGIVARAKGRLVSVDFAFIPHHQASELIKALLKASSSLRHITWSVSPDSMTAVKEQLRKQVARQALELAQVCPHIATLEVICDHILLPAPLWSSGSLQDRKLERFRTNAGLPRDLFPHLGKMLSQAKSVALEGIGGDAPLTERWLLELVGANSVLEEFVGVKFQDLQLGDSALAEIAGSSLADGGSAATGITTSLSLKKLSLRQAFVVRGTEVRLHAPNLRELATDARLLYKFSEDTIARLTTLDVQIWLCQTLKNTHPAGAMGGLEHIKGFTGGLTLEVGKFVTEYVLPILEMLADFDWPGLTSVSLVLPEASAPAASVAGCLPRIIAARKAGARGASREQYEAIASGTAAAATSSPAVPSTSTSQLSSNPFRRGAASGSAPSKSATPTAKTTFSGPPLCKEVTWILINYQVLPNETVAWLRQAGNVRLYNTLDSLR